MKKPHQEQLLQQLYDESKKQTKLPKDVTANVLAYAKNRRSPLRFITNWQTVCAAFLIGFLWLQPHQSSNSVYTVTADYTEDDQLVYYHHVSFDSGSAGAEVNNKPASLAKDPEYFAYLESLSKLQNSNQLAGIVKQSSGDVIVEVCQLGLVKLSAELLQGLGGHSQISEPLFVGQNVLLLTDNRGKFVGIEQQNNLNQCAE